MKTFILIIPLAMLVISLLGCSAPPASPPAASTPVPAPSKPDAAPAAAGGRACTAPAVTLSYWGNAMVELVSPEGTRVLVDVYKPDALTRPATDKDILLTTHTHPDHINKDFYTNFPGKQLFTKVGSLQAPGVNIQGLAAAHNSNDKVQAEGATDYIYIIEMGGLRIGHFGDLGQDALTPEQLSALGKIDIAISQLNNSYSAMSVENKKGFNQVDQLKPRLLLATHDSLDAAKFAATRWPVLYSSKPTVSICKSDLTDQTRVLFIAKDKYKQDLNLSEVGW